MRGGMKPKKAEDLALKIVSRIALTAWITCAQADGWTCLHLCRKRTHSLACWWSPPLLWHYFWASRLESSLALRILRLISRSQLVAWRQPALIYRWFAFLAALYPQFCAWHVFSTFATHRRFAGAGKLHRFQEKTRNFRTKSTSWQLKPDSNS